MISYPTFHTDEKRDWSNWLIFSALSLLVNLFPKSITVPNLDEVFVLMILI